MKRKYILATLIIAAATTINTINATATTTSTVEKTFEVKSDEIDEVIEIEDNEKKYILTLNNVVSENEVKEVKEKNVEEIKEYIVGTNDTTTILSQHPTIEYSNEEGSGVLNATEVISLESAGEDESYYETLETISRNITLTADQVNTMGTEVTNITIDGKEYVLTKAQFTPSEFINNEPSMYTAVTEYTTIVPHYEKTVNSYKVKIKYTGAIEIEEVTGYKTVASYSVEEVVEPKNNIVPVVVGATAGIGAFVLAGWFLLGNVALYSGNKKVKGYRKGSNLIQIDITKEKELYNDLNFVIKKSLAKRLDNTQIIIRANDKEVYSTILNSRNEEIRISI